MWQLLKGVLAIVAIIVIANLLLGFCAHTAFAQRVDTLTPEQRREQDVLDLRFMQKEIAKMRYTEICATIKKPPMSILQEIAKAAEAGDPAAQLFLSWLGPVVEAYQRAGCGDA